MKDRSKQGLTVTDAEFQGNKSGWEATDYKLFVLKDEVQEKTEGGIIVPLETKDTEYWNVHTGVVVSIGEMAFSKAFRKDGDLIRLNRRPNVGDRVMFKEFTGQRFDGDDGQKYLVLSDKEVIGIQTPKPAEKEET